jgi:hypothetical protein
MAARHGRLAYLSLAGNDVSAYFETIDFPSEVENTDISGFGQTHRTNLAGMIGATLTVDGHYDAALIAILNAQLALNQAGTPTAVILREGGTASGQTQEAFNANITSIGRGATLDEKVTISLGLIVTGAITDTVQ